ncbi:MAG: tetratricopeptide repeat protein [Bacteroidetes bacterium]|nr:tetratricopeptide repeat protein [Bacteroidota bacterium]
MKKAAKLITIGCCLSFAASAQKGQVQNGNKLYEAKQYKDAAKAYQQALLKNPSYAPGLFNLGNALYQEKNFDASRQVLTNLEKQTKDKNVKANATYNIGNSYMSEQKWQEAIDAYKTTLRNDPQDEAAKYNLSYALEMMKKNSGGGGGKNNKQQDQNKDDKNKNQKDKDNSSKDQQNKDQQQKQDQQQNNNDKKEDQQDNRPQPQPSKLSKEQADQLLNALAQEEKKLHDKKEKGKATQIKVDKDW